MAGGAAAKPSGSRTETRGTSTRAATVGAAGGNFGGNGNKLGFIRTSGPGKRKSITDPEPRESSRQKMSTYDPNAPSSAAATTANQKATPKGAANGKLTKMSLKPSKIGLPSTSGSTVQVGGHEKEGAQGAVGGAVGPGLGDSSEMRSSGMDGSEEDPEMSRELRIAIKAFQNSFGSKIDEIKETQKSFVSKIDEIKETLDCRVNELEKKIEGVEEMLGDRDKQVDEISKKVDMIPVDVQRSVATAVAKETGALNDGMRQLKDRQHVLDAILAGGGTSGRDNSAHQYRRPRKMPDYVSEKSARYWEARKCEKMSPIEGTPVWKPLFLTHLVSTQQSLT